MQKSDTRAFVNQLLVYTLVMLGFSGSVGVGTVWLRHQISVTANRTRLIEARIAEVERHSDELKADIDREQGPEALKQRNAQWKLGLVPPLQPQVVRVDEDAVVRFAAKRNREMYSDEGIRLVVFNTGGSTVR